MGLKLTKFDFNPAYCVHQHTDPNSQCLRFPRGFVGEGLRVLVEPIAAEPWVGCFERIPTYSDLLFACPNDQHLCVIAGGQGYIVKTNDPSVNVECPAVPINDGIGARAAGLIVLATFTDLLAYDARMDLRWHLRNVSDDGIKLDSLTANEVLGHRWSPASTTWAPFSIALPSGSSDAVGSIT